MKGSFYPETELLLRTVSGKKVLILSHVRPDWDTLASGFALKAFLAPHTTQITWGISEALSVDWKERIFILGQQPQLISSLREFNIIICVDFRSPTQAGELEGALQKFSGSIILLDHHSPSTNEFSGKLLKLLRPHTVACAQMVTQIGRELDADVTPTLARALGIAMITDTARFAEADAQTFETMSFLLEKSKQSYESLLVHTKNPVPIQSNVSVIKALRDVKLIGVNDYLLASVVAPFHNTPSANALIQLGADIALGIFPSPEGLFVSVRVSARAHILLGVDAMSVLLPLVKTHDGSCGGHARIAQATLLPYFTETLLIDAFSRELLLRVRKKDKNAKMKIY